MTRVNGTYLDRIIFSILPFALITYIFFILVSDASFIHISVLSLVVFAFYILLDSITYFLFKKVTSLKIDDKFLYFNKKQISPDQINNIQLDLDTRLRWSFPTIQFNYNNGDKIEVKKIIPKPQFFLSSEINESVKILIKSFPDLKDKYIK